MITMYAVWELRTDDPVSPDMLFSQGEKLMEALLDLELCNEGRKVCDSGVGVDAEGREIRVEFTVRAETLDSGTKEILGVMRTALHAVGAATPGWPAPDDVVAKYTAEYHTLVTA